MLTVGQISEYTHIFILLPFTFLHLYKLDVFFSTDI